MSSRPVRPLRTIFRDLTSLVIRTILDIEVGGNGASRKMKERIDGRAPEKGRPATRTVRAGLLAAALLPLLLGSCSLEKMAGHLLEGAGAEEEGQEGRSK